MEIQWFGVLISCFLLSHTVAGDSKTCELASYQSANTVTAIRSNLQNIVQYCEKKIGQIESKKETLEEQMRSTELQNVKFAAEKRKKEKKLKSLNEEIATLRKEVQILHDRIATTNTHISQVSERITAVNGRIAAAEARINNLKNTIKAKQDHINALVDKINREKAKKKCFGRKRRSTEEQRAPRVRRGFRVRRVVRKVVRETKRVAKQVVNLPKCVVNNIVALLSKDLEKAEREKNHLNGQLLQAQNEKVNIEGEKAKLVAQKSSDMQVLGELNKSVKEMNVKLNHSTKTKVETEEAICLLTNRNEKLTQLLQATDKQLKTLRETKTRILAILTTLKTIRDKKLEDLKEMEEAGKDIADILEDLNGVNQSIKKSVDMLIAITCNDGSLVEKNFSIDVESILKDSSTKCKNTPMDEKTKVLNKAGYSADKQAPNSLGHDELRRRRRRR